MLDKVITTFIYDHIQVRHPSAGFNRLSPGSQWILRNNSDVIGQKWLILSLKIAFKVKDLSNVTSVGSPSLKKEILGSVQTFISHFFSLFQTFFPKNFIIYQFSDFFGKSQFWANSRYIYKLIINENEPG